MKTVKSKLTLAILTTLLVFIGMIAAKSYMASHPGLEITIIWGVVGLTGLILTSTFAIKLSGWVLLPLSLCGLGIILNVVVMLANDGYMPVPRLEEGMAAHYQVGGKLTYLADYYGGFSIGDMFLLVSVVLFGFVAIVNIRAHSKRKRLDAISSTGR